MITTFFYHSFRPLLPTETIVLLYHFEPVLVGQCGLVELVQLGDDVGIALDSL